MQTRVSSQKLAASNMQFLCCWRLCNQHELDAVIEKLSAAAEGPAVPVRAGNPGTLQLPLRVLPEAEERNFLQALRRAFRA